MDAPPIDGQHKAPKLNRRYQHHSGRVYRVIELANLESDDPERYPVIVVYRDTLGHVWAKSVERFNASMTRTTG